MCLSLSLSKQHRKRECRWVQACNCSCCVPFVLLKSFLSIFYIYNHLTAIHSLFEPNIQRERERERKTHTETAGHSTGEHISIAWFTWVRSTSKSIKLKTFSLGLHFLSVPHLGVSWFWDLVEILAVWGKEFNWVFIENSVWSIWFEVSLVFCCWENWELASGFVVTIAFELRFYVLLTTWLCVASWFYW